MGVYQGKKGESYTAEKAAAELVLNNIGQVLHISVGFYLSYIILVPKERAFSGLLEHAKHLKFTSFFMNLETLIQSVPCFWVIR